ncbi:uncharacterized protein TrAFT101_005615 [Trichoderma asperellum]|nr:hypothetical protein TrAFT101_005615 [Trichoderma asperellum]
MPRPPKKSAEEKAKALPVAVVPPPTMVPAPVVGGLHPAVVPAPVVSGVPQRVVDNDSFLRVRDSAVGRLTTILELLRSFTNDYIRQTNLLLGEGTAEGPQGDLLNTFENAAAQLMMPGIPDMTPLVEEKKERKKRTHDPNAPKRPLTPYFLYMQHARSIIANDLGADAPKGAVQEEGQRRWAHMTPQEKQGWNNAYQYNLRLYNARVHSYKNGNPLAKNMSDEEALKYAEDFHIPMPELKEAAAQADVPVNDQDAIAEQLQQVAAAPSENEEEAPAKTPKKPASTRKRKTATPAAEVETPKVAAPASPDKKRRRTSTKAAEPEKEEPKKSGRKKTKST